MSKYEVKPVVCDYGVYKDGKVILICNSRLNALLIADIMAVDGSRPNKTTAYTKSCYERFVNTGGEISDWN